MKKIPYKIYAEDINHNTFVEANPTLAKAIRSAIYDAIHYPSCKTLKIFNIRKEIRR